ncbi:MAG TPA: hypothetical protein VE010_11490, partial [Thermoanaerobaculia bacterium]|nr:hypothetical protein [Thermoanaerobaculia bacterium]
MLLAILIGSMTFWTPSVPPGPFYTLFLLLLYPIAGALLGRFAVIGLAAAFAANAIATVTGTTLAVPLICAAVAVGLFRRCPWPASLLLLLPLWTARELGAAWPFPKKLLLTGSLFAAVTLLGLLAARRRWTLKPWVTIAIFALTMLASAYPRTSAPRDLPPEQPPPRVASPNIVLIVMDTV